MIPRFLLLMAGKIVRRSVLRHVAAFEEATHQPQKVQEVLLQRILSGQANTDFGREHRFSGIQGRADFQRQLPVAGYEFYEPYIARVRRGDLRALLSDPCVHMFALTSGTTAARKYIPVTPQYLADYKRGWNIWGLRAWREHKNARLRPIVQMSSDWDEFRSEGGIPCGSVTGLTALMQKRLVRWQYCVPACAARIKDPAAKYYLALRLSLPRRVGTIVAANPSTLINLARAGDQHKESLIRDLHDGTLHAAVAIPAEIRAMLAGPLRRRHPERARELEAIVQRTGTLYPLDYWPPELCLLGTWTGGSMGGYLRQFPRYFGPTPVRDVGLVASEGRMTIPLADNTASGVLDVTSHYFEFLPEQEADASNPVILGAHELEEGQNYFILPTTAFGLYRYNIHDLVRVTGFYNQTPLLEFLSKGSHFANITGEKLSEYHVTQAMAQTLREMDFSVSAYTMAPCWDDELPYYGLFVERGDFTSAEQATRLVQGIERRLHEVNVEYGTKRDSQRLGAVRLEFLPTGAWADWDRQRLTRSGGTPEQYKHPCLISDLKFRDSMPVEQEISVTQARSEAPRLAPEQIPGILKPDTAPGASH